MSRFERRIKMLECHSRPPLTAADYIRIWQGRPKTADEFVMWERLLSGEERAALQVIVDAELDEWRQGREGCA
jgi:hypothetical protein